MPWLSAYSWSRGPYQRLNPKHSRLTHAVHRQQSFVKTWIRWSTIYSSCHNNFQYQLTPYRSASASRGEQALRDQVRRDRQHEYTNIASRRMPLATSAQRAQITNIVHANGRQRGGADWENVRLLTYRIIGSPFHPWDKRITQTVDRHSTISIKQSPGQEENPGNLAVS